MARLDDRKLAMLDKRIDALRIKDKGIADRQVRDGVFDKATLMVFYELISDGVLDTLDFPISTGKEAKVFHGTAPGGASRAVKVFLVTNAVFKDILPYIHGDPRFEGIERDHRKVIMEWAGKEHANLRAFRDAGLRVPEPFTRERNVLVMEYVGDETRPAPLLKDVDLDEPRRVFDDLVGQVTAGVGEADLVHADLSKFNVLMWEDEPWIIDCGQSVSVDHPNAMEFLERDVENLCKAFAPYGIDADPDALFEEITGGDDG